MFPGPAELGARGNTATAESTSNCLEVMYSGPVVPAGQSGKFCGGRQFGFGCCCDAVCWAITCCPYQLVEDDFIVNADEGGDQQTGVDEHTLGNLHAVPRNSMDSMVAVEMSR
eukprot:SAG31_NODE_65_length_28565_cov_8.402914_26_plen_113_part_00